MADGRRNWQRWLDQVIDSLGSVPFYDPDFVWDPSTFVVEPKADWRGATAVGHKTEPKLRLHASRNFSSEDGPTAA